MKQPRLLEMGPANIYIGTLPHATGILDEKIFIRSVRQGAGLDSSGNPVDYNGNDVVVETLDPRELDPYISASPLTVSVTETTISVSLAVYAGELVSTVGDVIRAIEENPRAAFLVTVARALVMGEPVDLDTVMGADDVQLSGGSNVIVEREVGYLGEGLLYQVTTTAGNLTGAQAGDSPLDKIVTGGMVRVVVPFKEISLPNLSAGVPSARVTLNEDGSRRRVDFVLAAGQSIRQTLSVRMRITKVIGGFESPLPKDTIIIPEIGPAEGEVNFPFAPTTQREIMTNWYAWPHPSTGRWAYTGDEHP